MLTTQTTPPQRRQARSTRSLSLLSHAQLRQRHYWPIWWNLLERSAIRYLDITCDSAKQRFHFPFTTLFTFPTVVYIHSRSLPHFSFSSGDDHVIIIVSTEHQSSVSPEQPFLISNPTQPQTEQGKWVCAGAVVASLVTTRVVGNACADWLHYYNNSHRSHAIWYQHD